MARPKKTFTVYFDIKISTELSIPAETFEEALTKAKDYKALDLVELDSPHNDSEVEVIGVFK